MSNPINNTVFDTRDLIEYKEELEAEILDAYNEFKLELDEDFEEVNTLEDIEDLDEETDFLKTVDFDHYTEIKDFFDELENYCDDFTCGASVIHEDYFTDYCEELLKDCGYIPQDFPSWIELDFEATAKNMMVDYSEITYQGESYFIR